MCLDFSHFLMPNLKVEKVDLNRQLSSSSIRGGLVNRFIDFLVHKDKIKVLRSVYTFLDLILCDTLLKIILSYLEYSV